MKSSNTISALVGGAFFAVPYLALSIPILPSLIIGGSAFVAGELVFSKTIEEKVKKKNLKKIIDDAKILNNHITRSIPAIDDEEIKSDVKDINESVNKIISTIEKDSKKVKNVNNFLDYYLPITVKIIDRYNDIEDNLSSKENKKIVTSTKEMLKDINVAFKKILDNLYEKDIMDMSVEMKVFSSMLKSDGIDNDEIKVEE